MMLVPYLVVTRMLTVPVACAGALTVILVAVTVMMVPATVPNFTAVAPERLVPVIVTVFPPTWLPLVGDTEVIAGRMPMWAVLVAVAEAPPESLMVTLMVWVPVLV